MGRGRDKTIKLSDIRKGMSPRDLNAAVLGATRITGTAVVRDSRGNVRYENPNMAGKYGEGNV